MSTRTITRTRPAASKRRAGGTVKYVYWQDDGAWLGYLAEYPDYMTQGETLAELQENLKDILGDITQDRVPGVRKLAELPVP
jgi:hypothetical protein